MDAINAQAYANTHNKNTLSFLSHLTKSPGTCTITHTNIKKGEGYVEVRINGKAMLYRCDAEEGWAKCVVCGRSGPHKPAFCDFSNKPVGADTLMVGVGARCPPPLPLQSKSHAPNH